MDHIKKEIYTVVQLNSVIASSKGPNKLCHYSWSNLKCTDNFGFVFPHLLDCRIYETKFL